MFYVETTISVYKDGVCLFETDCECRIEYELPDGREGPADWDVTEFHFSDSGKYTKINRHEPLFHVLYNNMNRDHIETLVYDALAWNDDVARHAYADPS
jgi:hypothetical protein